MSEKEMKKCNCGCHEEEHTHCDCGCEDESCDCGCEDESCDCGCEDESCDCGCDFGEDIVEIKTDDGRRLKFYFVGTIEYKGKTYAAFEPAEEIEGLSEDELVILEVVGETDEDEELIPIEDKALEEEVFNEFCRVIYEDEMATEAEKLEPND